MSAYVYRVHPTIGIARVGNSEEFNLAPETMTGLPVPGSDKTTGGLPIRAGTESEHIRSSDIRDGLGALKRQAARFRIYQYPAGGAESYPNGGGVEIKIGSSVDGKLVKDILWTVHVANKKANTFQLTEDGDYQGLSSFQDGRLPEIRNAAWVTQEPKAPPAADRAARVSDPAQFRSVGQTPAVELRIAALSAATTSPPQPVQPPIEQRIAILNDPARVAALTIDPGPRAISGRSTPPVRFDRATEASYCDVASRITHLPGYPKSFPEEHFPRLVAAGGTIDTLGEIRTDEHGRLIFVGGYGRASGWKVGGVDPELAAAVNNDQWFDDASDGPVSAVIVFEDGSSADVHGAWVTATDPSTAPQILNAVSLWDDIYDIWVRQMGLAPQIFDQARGEFQVTYKPTFEDQIFPIFRSAVLQQWVTNMNPHARAAHKTVDAIKATDEPASTILAGLVPLFRNPNEDQFKNTTLMPLALGDGSEAMLALRKTQYFFLTRWNSGLEGFHPGSGPTLGGGEHLDKATFVACLGGRFSPGIDLTFIVRDPQLYVDRWQTSGSGPFRIHGKPMKYAKARMDAPFLTGGYVPAHNGSSGLEPGDVSKFMAIPWHTDYNSCATHPPDPNPAGNRKLFWSWPAQRPVAVFAADDVIQLPQPILDGEGNTVSSELGPQRWSVRGPGTDSPLPENWGRFQAPILQFVENWHRVGVVMQSTAIDAGGGSFDASWYLETQSLLGDTDQTPVRPFPNYMSTDPDDTTADERVLFYKLMNVESNPDVLGEARKFADYWLKWAENASNDPTETATDQLYFRYTEEAFQARLDMAYQEFVDNAAASDPALDPHIKNRADMVTRIIQFAPFNLTDGCWLRNIGGTGPIDEVRSLLFSILMDELGDGEISKNHCNLYLDLCHSLGYYPAPLNSSDFASDPQMLQSAFTLPAFQLAISQFSETYYPEILGMTLNLEWSVVDLKPTRDLAEFYGINPHFYVLHIGIDNAANGHGQRAAAAIRLFLQNARTLGGDDEVQRLWRRIWNGYFAFGNAGTLGQDLNELLANKPSLHDQMITMIKQKAKYGQTNHQEKMMAGSRIDAWFADPPGFLKALKADEWIIPGDWANSRMRRLMSFESGPMFRVFTPENIALWESYTNTLDQPPPKPKELPSSMVAMAGVIDQLRVIQRGKAGHQSAMLADSKGEVHSLAWWFERPTHELMAALSSPLNGLIVPGDPENSRFVSELIAPVGPMGSVFGLTAKASPDETCRTVVARWIKDGCEIPEPHKMSLRLNTRASARVINPRRKIRGNGAVH